ncbi:MAG: hypothetical protein GF347_01815 [Candidatus Moranbacteria bacterium]|nr:hypothetical protein [Candidatus Moranbacteria bacterium]
MFGLKKSSPKNKETEEKTKITPDPDNESQNTAQKSPNQQTPPPAAKTEPPQTNTEKETPKIKINMPNQISTSMADIKKEQPGDKKNETKPIVKINPPNQGDKTKTGEAEDKTRMNTPGQGGVNLKKEQPLSPDEEELAKLKTKYKSPIGLNIGSTVGSISFSKQSFGGSLTMETLTTYAKKYEEILKKVDQERSDLSRKMAELYKEFTEILEESDIKTEEKIKKQKELIPKLIKAIEDLKAKAREYNDLDPEDLIFEETKDKLDKAKTNLQQYLEGIKS